MEQLLMGPARLQSASCPVPQSESKISNLCTDGLSLVGADCPLLSYVSVGRIAKHRLHPNTNEKTGWLRDLECMSVPY